MSEAFLLPFVKGTAPSTAPWAARRRFERFISSAPDPQLATLGSVRSDCGFFNESTFGAIKGGVVLGHTNLPAPNSVPETFSVFSFLRFREGSDVPVGLPQEGWGSPTDAQRFIAAIQWFTIDVFGPARGRNTFFYRALAYLNDQLGSPQLLQAWSTVDRRSFSVVICDLAHDLWLILLNWFEGSDKLPLYYASGTRILRITGGSPGNHLVPAACIDTALQEWLAKVDERFPQKMMATTNAFCDKVPSSWTHLFLPPPAITAAHAPPSTAPAPVAAPLPAQSSDTHHRDRGRDGRRSRRDAPTDPDDPSHRSAPTKWLVKAASGRFAQRCHSRRFFEAIRPFPTFQTAAGKWQEICFSYACRGYRCRQSRCTAAHLCTRLELASAPPASVAKVKEWLDKPEVKEHIQLSEAASQLPCFR